MAKGMPWVKIETRILTDDRVLSLEPALRWTYVALIVLAGDCDAEGFLIDRDQPMTVEQIAKRMGYRKDRMARELTAIAAAGLIDAPLNDELITDKSVINGWLIVNYSSIQGRPQDEKRAIWRVKKAQYRAHRENVHGGQKKSVSRESTTLEGELEVEKTHTQAVEESKSLSMTPPQYVNPPVPVRPIPSPHEPQLKLFYQLTGCYDISDKQKFLLIERVTLEDIESGRFERVTNDFVANHKPKDYDKIGWLLTNLERARQPQYRGNGNGTGHKPADTPAARRNRSMGYDV